MRLIPAHITSESASPAEVWLFNQLQGTDLPDSWICFHSVNLPEHLYKQMGELDFVIVTPKLVLVLEIKGGGVACRDGVWHFTDRYGTVRRKREGPFQQARSGMFTLRNMLAAQLPDMSLEQSRFGFGVVFPDCDFTVSGVEWDQHMVFDARWRNGPDGVIRYLRQLIRWWQDKQGSVPKPDLTPAEIKRVVGALRPDFEMLPALRLTAEAMENRLISLTRQQYEVLDLVESNPRLLITGGAGTGKTLLAIEIARRHASAGDNVLFVCVSPVLASWIADRLPSAGVSVFALDQLVVHVAKLTGHDISEPLRTAPSEPHLRIRFLLDLLAQVSAEYPADQRWDVLVVDEGQDLMNLDFIAPISELIVGGIDHGRWRFFHDHLNQGAVFGLGDPAASDLLASCGATARLSRNCRNTDAIVIQTKLLTGADLGNESTGPGPSVRYRWYRDRQHCAGLLEEYLRELAAQGIESRFITVLSPLDFEHSSASLLPPDLRWSMTIVSGGQSQTVKAERLSFASISDFKGLENRFIALVDIDDVGSNAISRSLAYVGMSRARVSLAMFIDRSQKDYVAQLMVGNFGTLQEDLSRGHSN